MIQGINQPSKFRTRNWVEINDESQYVDDNYNHDDDNLIFA